MRDYCELPTGAEVDPCGKKAVAAIRMYRLNRTFGAPIAVCQEHLEMYRQIAATRKYTRLEIVEEAKTNA